MMQSAFARHVLDRQLLALALLNPSESGRSEMDVFFNDGMTSSRALTNVSILIVFQFGQIMEMPLVDASMCCVPVIGLCSSKI